MTMCTLLKQAEKALLWCLRLRILLYCMFREAVDSTNFRSCSNTENTHNSQSFHTAATYLHKQIAFRHVNSFGFEWEREMLVNPAAVCHFHPFSLRQFATRSTNLMPLECFKSFPRRFIHFVVLIRLVYKSMCIKMSLIFSWQIGCCVVNKSSVGSSRLFIGMVIARR